MWPRATEQKLTDSGLETSALYEGESSASKPGCFARGGKLPGTPLNRKLGGPQIQTGRLEEEKNILPVLGYELRSSIT
jgi:hypothetical protein